MVLAYFERLCIGKVIFQFISIDFFLFLKTLSLFNCNKNKTLGTIHYNNIMPTCTLLTIRHVQFSKYNNRLSSSRFVDPGELPQKVDGTIGRKFFCSCQHMFLAYKYQKNFDSGYFRFQHPDWLVPNHKC